MPSHDHKFAPHNYKKPTYCKHCDNMLMGFIKQGLRCKRCNIDIHMRCKDEYTKPCIEIVKGHHNFQEKNYHQPTYCDYCTKLLVGITKQGLRCSECQANVHLKCEEKIEPLCENTKLLGRKLLSPSKNACNRQKSKSNESLNTVETEFRKKSPRKAKKSELNLKKQSSSDEEMESRVSINIERPQSAEEVIMPVRSAMFDKMPPPSARRKSDTPMSARERSNVQALNNQVHEVEQIVKTNIEELQSRQERLENLEDKAEQINANSRQFEMQSKKIERKFYLQNKRCIIAVVAAVVLLIIIIILAVVIKKAI